jgi:hypothetical protein
MNPTAPMTPAEIVTDWFLTLLGQARATELLREEKTQRVLTYRQRKAAAKRLLRQRSASLAATDTTSDTPAPDADHMAALHAKGWTLRPAAKLAGVSFNHLHRVLRGERHSASLLRRIHALPHRQP